MENHDGPEVSLSSSFFSRKKTREISDKKKEIFWIKGEEAFGKSKEEEISWTKRELFRQRKVETS